MPFSAIIAHAVVAHAVVAHAVVAHAVVAHAVVAHAVVAHDQVFGAPKFFIKGGIAQQIKRWSNPTDAISGALTLTQHQRRSRQGSEWSLSRDLNISAQSFNG
jgi:hypothetical protein